MTTEEEMAVAVLKGDLASAKALADWLVNDSPLAYVTIPPLQKLEVAANEFRAVLYVDSILEMNESQIDAHLREAKNWLLNGKVLILQKGIRVELYQVRGGT